MTDVADLVAGFGAALRGAGVTAGPDRCARFARAVTLTPPATLAELRWYARTTLATTRDEVATLDRAFDGLFADPAEPAPASEPGDPSQSVLDDPMLSGPTQRGVPDRPGSALAGTATAGDGGPTGSEVEVPMLASAEERLAGRDFAELSPDELRAMLAAMQRLRLATPLRRSRRTRPVDSGLRIDLRRSLRRAYRTGGDPARLYRRRARQKPRRLIALCDISGSMQAYAQALLQLLYCAAGGVRAEVFTFATRLTRLTPVLAGTRPDDALAAAGQAAPDWSGGTRIGECVKEFIDGYGRQGMARGAVVLVISDGWETGDPTELGTQMARLSRLAYRIVWINPRTQSSRYRPLVGGMAAAWPYCDTVLSAHSLAAVSELVAALADPVRRRR